MITASYREASEFIFPCLGGNTPYRKLPADALLFDIAGQFDVHFVVCMDDEHGDPTEVVVTKPQLKRWRVKLDKLADVAGWNGGEVADWHWPPVKEGVRLFQYPEANDHWISHIVSPGCLLEHTDVPNPPIVMIPSATTVFIAGLPDHDAQALMFDMSRKAAGGESPITRRPLVIDKKWKHWNVLPDSMNPFAEEYEKHFGKV